MLHAIHTEILLEEKPKGVITPGPADIPVTVTNVHVSKYPKLTPIPYAFTTEYPLSSLCSVTHHISPKPNSAFKCYDKSAPWRTSLLPDPLTEKSTPPAPGISSTPPSISPQLPASLLILQIVFLAVLQSYLFHHTEKLNIHARKPGWKWMLD